MECSIIIHCHPSQSVDNLHCVLD